ncbi:MAG: Lipoyl synthase 2 [Candidatus Anoxychlamydiales bacterium]|nr:Lipoyl synthase 2 [Candidatus Anoxychlamydiales bacterium]
MKFPEFLRRKLPIGPTNKTNDILKKYNLNTVCAEANCPNLFECYSKKVATFLALGKKCTRACAFCNIDFSKKPAKPDINEPLNIAKATKSLNLRHVVITMVARDDLEDRGANHLAKIIKEVKKLNPNTSVEVLTSDFSCNFDLIDIITDQDIDIFNYNIETVKRLTSKVRHIATYENTLKILKYVKKSKKIKFVKSGFMVGLGETKKEVFETIKDLYDMRVDIITIGQYLSASNKKYPIKAFITPKEFLEYKDFAKRLGVKTVYADPYVRSSYNAANIIKLTSSK